MRSISSALIVAVGIAVGGWLIGRGFATAHNVRYVSVKGLAERDVKANLALWPINYVEAGNELVQVEAKVGTDDAAVAAFLQRHKIGSNAIVFRTLNVTDRAAQAFGTNKYPNRFIVTRTLMVRSGNVDAVAAASQDTGELITAGVVLDNGYGPRGGGPTYVFSGLNELKPAMIAEATRNARAAAEQFARDSGSRLGGIRFASQGVFQIRPRDDAPSVLPAAKEVDKTLRVVSTVQYRLIA